MDNLGTNKFLTPKILIRSGILEEYWGRGFEDFYGHPEKRKILEPKVDKWNKGFPEARINLDFNKGKEILDEVLFYAENLEKARQKGISILLFGPNGTGKTLLGCCLLKVALLKGYSVQMTSLGGIIEAYTDGWTEYNKRERFNKRIKNVDFLLIDDVGKEYRAKSNDLTEIAFDNLIRYRSFRHKPFILTTNASSEALHNTYGKSLMSLIYGKCLNIFVDGVDYRSAIQAKDIKSELGG